MTSHLLHFEDSDFAANCAVQKVMSDKVILSHLIKFLTPCAWINLHNEVKFLNPHFDKETTTNKITRARLRDNLMIFFSNEHHIVDTLMELVHTRRYAIFGDFVLFTLHGDSLADCDLVLVEHVPEGAQNDTYETVKWRSFLDDQVGDIKIENHGYVLTFHRNLQCSFHGRRIVIFQTHFDVHDFMRDNICNEHTLDCCNNRHQRALDFCNNCFCDNKLILKNETSVLARSHAGFSVDDEYMTDIIECQGDDIFKIAKQAELFISSYAQNGYLVSLCAGESALQLANKMTRYQMAVLHGECDEEACARPCLKHKFRKFCHYLQKALVWNTYWYEKRYTVGGAGFVVDYIMGDLLADERESGQLYTDIESKKKKCSCCRKM